MPIAPRLLGGCPLPLEEAAEEEEDLASKGLDSMDARVKAEAMQTLYAPLNKRIPSKGALGSKKGLKTETINDHSKNIYSWKHEMAIRYRESKVRS